MQGTPVLHRLFRYKQNLRISLQGVFRLQTPRTGYLGYNRNIFTSRGINCFQNIGKLLRLDFFAGLWPLSCA